MARWLGIDHGTKRIGIAAGNLADRIATPLAVIPAQPLASAIRQVLKLAEDYGAEGIVVGWPLNMDGSEGPQAKLAMAAAGELERATGLDVRLWDERLSSFEADEALAGKLTRKKKRERQDAVAAAAMLHDFFSSGGPQRAQKPRETPPSGKAPQEK